jgi:hypothetical protein
MLTKEIWESAGRPDVGTCGGYECLIFNPARDVDPTVGPNEWDVFFRTVVPPFAKIIFLDSPPGERAHPVYRVSGETVTVG